MSTDSPADLVTNLVSPLLIATLRIFVATAVAPLFPASIFPRLLRNTIVVSLSLLLFPHVAAHMPPPGLALGSWFVLIGKELLIGVLIGLSIGVMIRAFEGVGALIDVQTGMGNGSVYDPFGGHGEGPMASFMTRLAVALFIGGGGLYVMVTLLFESFGVWPVAAFHPSIDIRLADLATAQFNDIARLSVRLAAPAILVLALVDLGFGLINRVVPQLNVFFFTMPIKGIMSALMIALFLPFAADVVAQQLATLSGVLDQISAALAARR